LCNLSANAVCFIRGCSRSRVKAVCNTIVLYCLYSGAVCYTVALLLYIACMLYVCCMLYVRTRSRVRTDSYTVVSFVTLWPCCCTCAVCSTCTRGAVSRQTKCVMTLTCLHKLQTKVQTGSWWIHPPASWRMEASRHVTRPLTS
jgi:hypothetical protein